MPIVHDKRALKRALRHRANRWKLLPPDQQARVLADRAQRRDAARAASTDAPSCIDRKPGEVSGYIEVCIDGVVTRRELRVPGDANGRRARVDSHALMDGGVILEVGGLAVLFRAFAQLLARPLSRKAAATLPRSYSARDEAAAQAAHHFVEATTVVAEVMT